MFINNTAAAIPVTSRIISNADVILPGEKDCINSSATPTAMPVIKTSILQINLPGVGLIILVMVRYKVTPKIL